MDKIQLKNDILRIDNISKKISLNGSIDSFKDLMNIFNNIKEFVDNNIDSTNEQVIELLEEIAIFVKNYETVYDKAIKDIRNFNTPKLIESHDSWYTKSDDVYKESNDLTRSMLKDIGSIAKGNIPGHIQNEMDILNGPPKVRWEDIIRNKIGSISVPFKKTMLRRDRRQPKRYDIRGRMADKAAKVAVAIDTSGSMSDEEIEYALNEIFGMLKFVKFEMTIIECDAEINRIYKVKTQNDIKNEVQGRGGTLFEPVFEYFDQNRNETPDILIYFTDGGGESALPKMYHHNKYETIFVITESRYSNTLSIYDDIHTNPKFKVLKFNGEPYMDK